MTPKTNGAGWRRRSHMIEGAAALSAHGRPALPERTTACYQEPAPRIVAQRGTFRPTVPESYQVKPDFGASWCLRVRRR